MPLIASFTPSDHHTDTLTFAQMGAEPGYYGQGSDEAACVSLGFGLVLARDTGSGVITGVIVDSGLLYRRLLGTGTIALA